MSSCSSTLKIIEIDINNHEKLVKGIKSIGGDGVIVLNFEKNSFVTPPSSYEINKLFKKFKVEGKNFTKELNNVYTKNLIFKNGKELTKKNKSAAVDQKNSFDLSPKRINIIKSYNPSLLNNFDSSLNNLIGSFESLRSYATPKILKALNESKYFKKNLAADSIDFNYRMLEYYPLTKLNNRCKQHQDFGLFTIIFQDNTGGLEIKLDTGKWCKLGCNGENKGILLFGKCAEYLSNGKIKALIHRVVCDNINKENTRNSGVFFVEPKENVLLGDSDILTQDLKDKFRIRWKKREGTYNLKN